MGYVRKATIYRLVFEDPELAGLEVRVKSMTTGQLMDLTRAASHLAGRVGGEVRVEDLAPEDLAALDMMFGALADALASWNLEDCPLGDCPGPDCGERHEPVPATLAGVRAQETPLTLRLVNEWMRAAGGVSAPLVGRSTSGATFPEASLPMEPLSISR